MTKPAKLTTRALLLCAGFAGQILALQELAIAQPVPADVYDAEASIYAANREVVSLYQRGLLAEAITLAEATYQDARDRLGERHPNTLTSLNNLAFYYHATGRYDEAEPLYLEALNLRREILGPRHPHTLSSLNNLAGLYSDSGRLAAAEPLLEEVLELRREALGERHPDTIVSLNNLAGHYVHFGRYVQAEPLLLEAVELFREVFGESHPNTLTGLNNVAFLYQTTGRYAEAEALYREALELRREVLGGRHPDTLASLSNLAGNYQNAGRYSEAEPLYLAVLQIRREILGARHPDSISSLNNLAYLYQATGRYAEAERRFLEALALRREVLGARHPDTITSLNSLASLYRDTGHYAEAERRFLEALELRRDVLGERHPSTLVSMGGLARLYQDTGRYAEAEPLFVSLQELSLEILGVRHPDTLSSLNNLAFLYHDTGRYAEAEPLYLEALELTRDVLGAQHPSTLIGMHNLAALYQDTGRFSLAEPLYREALELSREVLGAGHPNTFTTLNNLGGLYDAAGRYAEAEPLFRETLGLSLEILGIRHPLTLTTVNNLAALFKATGRYAEAEPLYREALELRREVLGARHPDTLISLNNLAGLYAASGQTMDAVALLSEGVAASMVYAGGEADLSAGAERRAAALGSADTAGDFALALAAHAPGPETAALAARVALVRKGLGAERQAALLALARQDDDPDLAALATEYIAARRDFAAAYERIALREDTGEEAQVAFAAAEDRLDSLEQDLSAASAEFRALEGDGLPDPAEVAAALAPGAVLVEQVIFRPYDFAGDEWGPLHAGAVVLRSGADPVFVDLGPLDPLRPRIRALLAQMGADDDGATAARRLYRALVEPLEPHLADAETVHLAPAGPLGLIPYALLRADDAHLWGDLAELRLVSSGRALLQAPAPRGTGLVAFGAVDFDAQPAVDAAPTADLEVASLAAAPGTTRSGAGNLSTFEYLRHTPQEIRDVADLWRSATGETAEIFAETGATEAALAGVSAPRVLHLATHGFVTEAEGNFGRAALLSGIALTGANLGLAAAQSDTAADGPAERSLGLALGYEIETFDLRGTELVVVSACETGLGATDVNEGVYSLARAFGIAGAEAVLVTLRPVDDALTAAFMADFYRAWQGGPAPRTPAQALADVRAAWAASPDPIRADPRTWAPFVIVHTRT